MQSVGSIPMHFRHLPLLYSPFRYQIYQRKTMGATVIWER
jgi:hypothetical protein